MVENGETVRIVTARIFGTNDCGGRIMARTSYGRTFRTRSGRLGRYVYRNGRKIAFKAVRSSYRTAKRGFKTGARRYVADRTYRYARRRFK